MDPPLSDRGRAEAAAVAEALRAAALAAVYSSPLVRARETAEDVAGTHRLPVILHDGLREFSAGEWEGLTTEQIEDGYASLLRQWWSTPHLVRIPGGESLEELTARAVAAVEEIRRRHEGKAVAVVAHGGANKTILLAALGAPLSSYYRINQVNGCVNVLDYEGDRTRVIILNDVTHLGQRPGDVSGWPSYGQQSGFTPSERSSL